MFIKLIIGIHTGTVTDGGYIPVRLTISNAKDIIKCRYYKVEVTDIKAAVILVGGVGGGWDSPAKGLYHKLS